MREMLLGTREISDYVECRDCGCVQRVIFGDSDEGNYGALYYTQTQAAKFGRLGGIFGLRARWTRFRLGPGQIRRSISGRRYGRMDWFRRTRTGIDDAILDVGCGSGRLLTHLRRDGFSSLVGIDPNLPLANPEMSTLGGSGFRLLNETVEAHEGRYQLVMAHHSFEHMHDPAASFCAMAKLVEPGGFLLLRVPRADSWAYRHYGADWCQLDAPRHLHLLTRKSLEVLCAGAGLRIAHVEDDSGPFQIWGSELYRRDIALADVDRLSIGKRLAIRWARIRAIRRARALRRQGLGDQACFYLEKRRSA